MNPCPWLQRSWRLSVLIFLSAAGLTSVFPADVDTDGDGLSDEWETAHDTNPQVYNLAEDFYYDGILDQLETEQGIFYSQTLKEPPVEWKGMEVRVFIVFKGYGESGDQVDRVVDDYASINDRIFVILQGLWPPKSTDLTVEVTDFWKKPTEENPLVENVFTATSSCPNRRFLSDYTLRFVAIPKIQIAVDADRNGEIKFAEEDESDQTAEDRPFRFWLNDDRDSTGEDVETGPVDCADETISHVRDLEDFEQIAIKLDSKIKDKVLNQQYTLAVETTGGLQINLYKAVQAGTGYLTDETLANQQLNGTYRIGTVDWCYGQSVPLNNLQSRIRPEEYGDTPIPFIFEGKTAGEGTIKLLLKKPDGTVESTGEVHVKLMEVRDMFEWARATSNQPGARFRLPWEKPYTYEEPTVNYLNVTPNFQPPPGEEKQCIVFVHGFNNTLFERQNWSETMFKRLWHQGYKGRFAAFHWPTPIEGEGKDMLFSTEYLALKYGAPFKAYLGELRGRLNGYSMNVAAHSAGNIVTGEALRQGAVIDNYALMQAAVPASCYDKRDALFQPDLVKADKKKPTPDLAANLGYRGYLKNVQGNLVNFYNPVDGALETGFDVEIVLWGWRPTTVRLSYHIFQRDFKPLDSDEKKVEYAYNKKRGVPLLLYPKVKPSKETERVIVNAHESMAFVARSRAKAVGAEGATGGSIDTSVNLRDSFRFGDTRSEHSAQFIRNIQTVSGFYYQLGISLRVLKEKP